MRKCLMQWTPPSSSDHNTSLRRTGPTVGGHRANRTKSGGARGVIVIVVGNGHGKLSSNPGRVTN